MLLDLWPLLDLRRRAKPIPRPRPRRQMRVVHGGNQTRVIARVATRSSGTVGAATVSTALVGMTIPIGVITGGETVLPQRARHTCRGTAHHHTHNTHSVRTRHAGTATGNTTTRIVHNTSAIGKRRYSPRFDDDMLILLFAAIT